VALVTATPSVHERSAREAGGLGTRASPTVVNVLLDTVHCAAVVPSFVEGQARVEQPTMVAGSDWAAVDGSNWRREMARVVYTSWAGGMATFRKRVYLDLKGLLSRYWVLRQTGKMS
jgi:hypothetical protein